VLFAALAIESTERSYDCISEISFARVFGEQKPCVRLSRFSKNLHSFCRAFLPPPPGGQRTRARICKKFPRLAASKSGLRNFANGVTLCDQASVSAGWDYYSVIREREGRRFHTKRETRSLPVSCVKIEKSPVLSRHFLRAIHFTARS